MNIREQEDDLFSDWQKNNSNASFTIDGCPSPDLYVKETRRTIFVLKDANLGKDKMNIFDLRSQLCTRPDLWWHTIAKWCYFLHHPDHTWQKANKEITKENRDSIKKWLSLHCFIQLKKKGGDGSISNATLEELIKDGRYKTNIIRQLSIYEPNYIVGCGNGEHLSKLFNCSKADSQHTSQGIRYWRICLNSKPCFLIDYCHPSVRCGTKVKGLIAKGLSDSILEIERTLNK